MLVGFVEKNRRREITVNCKCDIRIPGYPAVGEVTNVPLKKIVVAPDQNAKQHYHLLDIFLKGYGLRL
ncbi:MAG: hypothetical protein OEW95_07665 [Candidatus Bathyarchaeota archaeon]|nr:hypothetical protein [Candidatus Bathyarchaeota archaeon]